ncbi:unnamed protein product [Durusdinium trenchii]|uniref:Uncharacterized protein n=1 Tax=Durusdinium trenchii TaxID=1381693 RepID=A0ABP0PSS2_9DINO
MARRVRAEAKPLTRCPYGHAPSTAASRPPPPAVEETLLEVVPDAQLEDDPPPSPPSTARPDEGDAVGAAVPVYAPESVMVNAVALLNPPAPWNAIAECRQQAERLAELESQVLEECRQRQERLWRSELQEQLHERDQHWQQQQKELEGQLAFLERRLIESKVSSQEAEMQQQQDARLRYQVVQERCNTLATTMAEEQAAYNVKHLQLEALQQRQEQDVSKLHGELLASQKEMEVMRLEERTLATCAQEEFQAEAACNAFSLRRAEAQARQAEEETSRAEEAFSGLQMQLQATRKDFQVEHLQVEERLQQAEHSQQMARRLSVGEEELAARAQRDLEESRAEAIETKAETEDLRATVMALTAELQVAHQKAVWEEDQRQVLHRTLKDAYLKQEAFLDEVHAAQTFAAEATQRAEETQRERHRDLREFQRILRQHQDRLELEQRKEVWEELQKAVLEVALDDTGDDFCLGTP